MKVRQSGIPARTLLALTLMVLAISTTGCGSHRADPAAAAPKLHVLSTITDGAVLTDAIQWIAQPVGVARGDSVDRVEFSIDGRLRWTERQAPYFFNDDYNHLFPWVLGSGPHRLAVRVVTVAGKTAGTSAQVTVKAGLPPAAIQGTYTRTVTAANIQRTAAFRHEPPDQVLPAGAWRLHVTREGVFLFDDPQGGGGSEAFTALTNRTLMMHGPVNWLEPARRRGGFCGVEPLGTYHWRITGRTLVLTPRSDRCADRSSLFSGTWRRT